MSEPATPEPLTPEPPTPAARQRMYRTHHRPANCHSYLLRMCEHARLPVAPEFGAGCLPAFIAHLTDLANEHPPDVRAAFFSPGGALMCRAVLRARARGLVPGNIAIVGCSDEPDGADGPREGDRLARDALAGAGDPAVVDALVDSLAAMYGTDSVARLEAACVMNAPAPPPPAYHSSFTDSLALLRALARPEVGGQVRLPAK